LLISEFNLDVTEEGNELILRLAHFF